MSLYSLLDTHISTNRPLAKQLGYRLPIIMTGEKAELEQALKRSLQSSQEEYILSCGLDLKDTSPDTLSQNNKKPSETTHIKNKDFRHYLGHEFDIVIINGFAGFHPDAIASLSGTVKAGGLFILLMPAIEDWPRYPDPDKHRHLQWPHSDLTLYSYFLDLLANITTQSLDCFSQVQADDDLKRSACFYSLSLAEMLTRQESDKNREYFSLPQKPTAQQNHIIERCLKLKNKQALVITADRGRGKSACLGMAAAELIKQQKIKPSELIITAPRPDCAKQISYWLEREIGTESAACRFIPPDELIKLNQSIAVLFVDEAAAIPPALLKKLTQLAKKIVFTTTVHGYEGSGRGFSIRFIKWLKQNRTSQMLTLTQAIRWSNNDPLEILINKLFLLSVQDEGTPECKISSSDNANGDLLNSVDFAWHSSQSLLKNKAILKQAFNLLIQAHYRTSPSDLRYLLDATNLNLALAMLNNEVIGVVLMSNEGGLPGELSQAILQGERRPQGHLFPQVMIAQQGFCDFGLLEGQRIVRIAVKPNLQNKMLGSQFLQWLIKDAKKQNKDYLCTSFGSTAKLIKFWHNNDFDLVRLGLQAESSTGEYTAAMLLSISEQAKTPQALVQQRHQKQLESLLKTRFKYQNAEQIWQWLGSTQQNKSSLSDFDKTLIKAFSHHNANFDSALLSIEQLMLNHLSNGYDAYLGLLVHAIFCHWSSEELCEHYKLTGKKQVLKTLRESVAQMALVQSQS